MTLPADIESKKQVATAWFRSFRDQLCHSLEPVEAEVTGPHADRPAGKFEIEPWQREAGGGSGSGTAAPIAREVFDFYLLGKRPEAKQALDPDT